MTDQLPRTEWTVQISDITHDRNSTGLHNEGFCLACAEVFGALHEAAKLVHPIFDADFLGRAANGLTIAAEGNVHLDKKYALMQAEVLNKAARVLEGRDA